MSDESKLNQESIYSKSTRLGQVFPSGKTFIPVLEAYTIQGEIGRGGMAVVYEAVEKSLNRTVALKVLNQELSQDNDLIRRFVNEAQAAARLSHPNIVQIYSIGQEKGVYYFAMEYVRGDSVEDMLVNGKKFSVLKAVEIVKQTVHALQEAYKNNIIHRDIKPGNILITEQGFVKVADFGLAAEVKGAAVEKGGRIIGTPLYMSPEQAQGKEADFRSDIYSLGITFYQILKGEPPFKSADTKILIKKHIESDLPPLPADVSVQIKKIITVMTEKDPEKRFSDYGSLLKELERVEKKLIPRRYTIPIIIFGLILAAGAAGYALYQNTITKKIELPPKVETYERVKEIFINLEQFAKKHPEDHEGIVKAYSRFIKDYPGTELAFRAEEKIDKIIIAVATEGREELKQLASMRAELISKNKYQEVLDKYREIKEKYKGTFSEGYASEIIDRTNDEARTSFQAVEDKAKKYLDRYEFDAARKLYKEVIGNYGIDEIVKTANDRVAMINEKEESYKLQREAENVFKPVKAESEKLVTVHKYDEARELISSVEKVEQNPLVGDLVKNELEKIEESEIKYATETLNNKITSQYDVYKDINDRAAGYIIDYKYKDALSLISEGEQKIDILELRKELNILKEKLRYLDLFKDSVIVGINKELDDKNVKYTTVDENMLIFVVEGGYVGVPWKGAEPEKIYQFALKYVENNAEGHMAMGVFCLTYGLNDDARREFTLALRIKPEMQSIVEKYFIKLAEQRKENI